MKHGQTGNMKIIYAGVVVIVLAAAGGGYLWWSNSQVKQKAAVTVAAAVEDAAGVATKANQAISGANGSAQAGVDVYNKAIAQTKDTATQTELYESQSTLARNN